jgi:hypothetical protein
LLSFSPLSSSHVVGLLLSVLVLFFHDKTALLRMGNVRNEPFNFLILHKLLFKLVHCLMVVPCLFFNIIFIHLVRQLCKLFFSSNLLVSELWDGNCHQLENVALRPLDTFSLSFHFLLPLTPPKKNRKKKTNLFIRMDGICNMSTITFVS